MVKCDLSYNALDSTKNCTACCKEYSIDQFVGMKNNITKTCKNCRDNNKIQDAKRNKDHRNEVARKNEAKPENKAVKAKWNEENYDKVSKKWMDCRQRKIEKLGTEEYLKQQAEQAKKWRENNPEKTEEANTNKRNSKKLQYNVYKRSASYKNLDFTISYDDYVNIVDKDCYYCGIIQEKGFNGIDRKDQTKGYLLHNCVSCCKMCNYMKGSCSDEVFIKRIEHILTFQNKISGNLYPQCFANHNCSPYKRYKERALQKGIEYLITEDEYNEIKIKDCFMCGKKSDENHTNGIDRFDNIKGYFIDNVNSCCGECNFIKKDYRFDDIINKFKLIYETHSNNIYTNSIVFDNNIIVKGNKKSKEEIQNEANARKENSRQELVNRYNDDEYKFNKCLELAAKRKNVLKN
jgi:hypothetical protein